MADYQPIKDLYDNSASTYNSYVTDLPQGILETQLIASALGDCSGQTVLDLGGGTGARARQAVDAGAISVDVVDITPGMLRAGQAVETSLGRNKINWYEADASRPLDHLPLQQYDVVMVNWLFDHAANLESLEGMWQNTTKYLKPRGRFIGVRSGNPRAAAYQSGKYGVIYKNLEPFPHGVKLHCTILTNPPLDFEATLMDVVYTGSTEMHTKYGLEDVQLEPFENAEAVRNNPDFWALYLEQPPMVVVKARKRSN